MSNSREAFEAWVDGQWISVEDATPSQGERVLLAIRYENCPVVGYWSAGEYEACCVNHEVECWGDCGGLVKSGFESDEVTHWMILPEVPTNDR